MNLASHLAGIPETFSANSIESTQLPSGNHAEGLVVSSSFTSSIAYSLDIYSHVMPGLQEEALKPRMLEEPLEVN